VVIAPVTALGSADDSGTLSLSAGGDSIEIDAETLAAHRRVIEETVE
jgi:hypothetical protein